MVKVWATNDITIDQIDISNPEATITVMVDDNGPFIMVVGGKYNNSASTMYFDLDGNTPYVPVGQIAHYLSEYENDKPTKTICYHCQATTSTQNNECEYCGRPTSQNSQNPPK